METICLINLPQGNCKENITKRGTSHIQAETLRNNRVTEKWEWYFWQESIF